MDKHLLVSIQNIVHNASLVILGLAGIIILVSILKPGVLKKIMGEMGERKYVLSSCLFVSLLCSTVFIATQSDSNKSFVSENTKQTISAVDLLQQPDPDTSKPVDIQEVMSIEPIPYPKEQRNEKALAAGHVQLIQPGKNGQITRVYAVTFTNGQETSRLLKSETTTLEPIPEITAIGTSKSNSSQNSNYGVPQATPDNAQSERNFLPSIKLTCNNSSDSAKSGMQICLYNN